MAIDPKDIRSILNGLIQNCKDGQQGFIDAAQHVHDPAVKSMFLELSQQRSRFAGELQQEVTRLQGQPETDGSTAGALHRGWVDFKTRIAGQSDQAAISEVQHGDDGTVKAYEKAMDEELPGDIRDIVERQFNAIVVAYRRIRTLQVRTRGGAA